MKSGCKCAGFKSSYTCNCGEPTYAHTTLVETREEREARGHPVGAVDVPYQAMGGITGFSSLADGYLRLDPSGRGRPSDDFFEQPITSNDNPFLRQFATNDMVRNPRTGQMELTKEAKAAERRPDESELDYYERRYKERVKLNKLLKRETICILIFKYFF
jgi:hypothetical protein